MNRGGWGEEFFCYRCIAFWNCSAIDRANSQAGLQWGLMRGGGGYEDETRVRSRVELSYLW